MARSAPERVRWSQSGWVIGLDRLASEPALVFECGTAIRS